MVEDVSASCELDKGRHFNDNGSDVTYELGAFAENEACGSFLIRFYCRFGKKLNSKLRWARFSDRKIHKP